MLWQRELSQALSQPRPDGSPLRLAIVGVGQELQGDDGVGVAIARRLNQLVDHDDSLVIIEAGHAPENVLGSIIRFQPSIILFIDALKVNERPGSILWLTSNEADSAGGSTHTLSLALLGDYLRSVTGASTYVLGIQPRRIAFGEGLSAPVEAAVEDCAEAIAHYWRKAAIACSAMTNGGVSVVNT
jgi:hydrogenase 3 maturation protease